MKRICILLALVLLLGGCGKAENNTAIQVSILEGDGFTVANNGQWIVPGDDAVFYLDIAPGFALGSTDFEGAESCRIVEGRTELTLRQVRYPTRIHLTLTEDFAQITYDPNGADGETVTITYDQSLHSRPNTSNGRDLFTREGYTLTGWNTEPDGSGARVGLGSRVTADAEGITLYAQWARWNPSPDFTYTDGVYLTITGYRGNGEEIVIPETIGGKVVGGIAYNAFRDCDAKKLILPPTMVRVAEGAFQSCDFESVILFDSIEGISNASFKDCNSLHTIHINAFEAPYGFLYRKESVYADKVDLLIQAQGKRKLVFYGGCAAWYNLDARQFEDALGENYEILNLALNGTVNSALQLRILQAFLEPGDILFHTPELSSKTQMMEEISLDRGDDKLWCGLENNYDLVSLVDFQASPGLLDSFCAYLELKKDAADYGSTFLDSQGRMYLDDWGCIPFARTENGKALSDAVCLDPACVDAAGMERLAAAYQRLTEQDIRVYVGFACINLDAVPEAQQENVELMDQLFRQAIAAMDGPVLVSRLEDYLYHNEDFYDTNYHLLSRQAGENTALWLRDLLAQMKLDAEEATP